MLLQQAGKTELLVLHAIGMIGFATQQFHVELGNRARLAVTMLGVTGDQTVLQDLIHQTKLTHHVQRRRMPGRGTQILGQSGITFEHGDRYAGTRQHQRCGHAHWPGAGNQYTFDRHCCCLAQCSAISRPQPCIWSLMP